MTRRIAHARAIGYRVQMTAADLDDILLSALVRRYGGTRRRWRLAVGPVRTYSLVTHAHRNWSVSPSGSVPEVAAIEAIVDELAGRHPIVTEA